MIKSRKDQFKIAGNGPHILALDNDQLELMGAILGMIKLGYSKYQLAALALIESLEELSGDDQFISTALVNVEPILEVHDGDSYTLIAEYDEDFIFEFIV